MPRASFFLTSTVHTELWCKEDSVLVCSTDWSVLSSTLWYPDSFMLPSATPVSENLHLRSHQASPTRHSPKYGIPCGELHVSFCMLPSSQLHFILPSEAPVCAAGRRPKALRFRRRSHGPRLPHTKWVPWLWAGRSHGTRLQPGTHHCSPSFCCRLPMTRMPGLAESAYLRMFPGLIITDAVCCVKSLPVSWLPMRKCDQSREPFATAQSPSPWTGCSLPSRLLLSLADTHPIRGWSWLTVEKLCTGLGRYRDRLQSKYLHWNELVGRSFYRMPAEIPTARFSMLS